LSEKRTPRQIVGDWFARQAVDFRGRPGIPINRRRELLRELALELVEENYSRSFIESLSGEVVKSCVNSGPGRSNYTGWKAMVETEWLRTVDKVLLEFKASKESEPSSVESPQEPSPEPVVPSDIPSENSTYKRLSKGDIDRSISTLARPKRIIDTEFLEMFGVEEGGDDE
jgi:hypothetical protein